MRIAYFVHDATDANVLRRVRMLHEGGADVVVLGFRRLEMPLADIDGAPVVDLGRTFDGRFGQRVLQVVGQVAQAPLWGAKLRAPDVVLARNLEMLTLASVARRLHAPRARMAYECLDIHRLMTAPTLQGQLLRSHERRLLRETQLLIVSSPAYVRAHFRKFQGLGATLSVPTLVLENKVLELESKVLEVEARGCSARRRPPGPPWRIGWFGMLRCRRSFEILRSLAARLCGAVEIVVAGRPSDREFTNFDGEIARAPGVTYAGAYRPEDLERMYREIHFTWAIDFFEAGANSDWLLPNRLYEGGRYGAVPIALQTAETGRWLEQRRLGLVVRNAAELDQFFAHLDAPTYRRLEARSEAAPSEWFAAGRSDCRALLEVLGGVC
jgi:hypothetical protein